MKLTKEKLLNIWNTETEDEMCWAAYIADLILSFLDSLQFRCVGHYTKAFPFILFKFLLIADLCMRMKKQTLVILCQHNCVSILIYNLTWMLKMIIVSLKLPLEILAETICNG